MKILLFGKNGQVGWELNRSLQPLGEIVALNRNEADFSNPECLRAIVQENKPDVIINAAAYTAVDRAEEEEAQATIINATAVGILAEEASKLKALLIHYSTDYVFDGTKLEPYIEADVPNPINAYGRSKLAGEEAVVQSGCEYIILRVSWVYAARGSNFLSTMLRLSQEREELRVVADQYGVPTWARSIADATTHVLAIVQRELQAGRFASNVYHLSAAGKTSWHGFASAIIERARYFDTTGNVITETVIPIATEDYPLPAARPKNSQIDSAALISHFELVMPDWQHAMKLCIDEILTIQ